MAFGQASGPPASAKQVRELLDLLAAAGHDGFRDARGPMGFDQRQAGGKFTRDDAQAFIDRLEQEAYDLESTPSTPSPPDLTPAERAMSDVSDQDLLAEVRRRGLTVRT